MNWKPIFAFLLLDSFLLLICQGNVQVSANFFSTNFLAVLLRCLQYRRKKIDFFVSMSRNTQVYKNFPQYVWGEKWSPLFFCNSNTLLSPLTKNMKTSIFNMRHQGALVSQLLLSRLIFWYLKKKSNRICPNIWCTQIFIELPNWCSIEQKIG